MRLVLDEKHMADDATVLEDEGFYNQQRVRSYEMLIILQCIIISACNFIYFLYSCFSTLYVQILFIHNVHNIVVCSIRS